MSVFDAKNPCPCGAPMLPPGDCTPEKHRALQDDVNQKCKSEKRSCKGVNDCATLLANWGKNMDCVNARQLVATICFKGGDEGHRTAIVDALNAAAYCMARYTGNCVPKPQPVPVPAPQPAPAPVSDDDFMEKMSKLTGLTGTALVIYLILSEGSRLFPPRNLIPVP